MLTNISRVSVRRMGPDSFQWCPVTGQGSMGTNWTWGRTSSLWGWRSPGPGCPGRLWSLLLWRYSNPAWTLSCAACSGWPCFGRGFWLDDPQRSLPTLNILWFCDSVSGVEQKRGKEWRYASELTRNWPQISHLLLQSNVCETGASYHKRRTESELPQWHLLLDYRSLWFGQKSETAIQLLGKGHLPRR